MYAQIGAIDRLIEVVRKYKQPEVTQSRKDMQGRSGLQRDGPTSPEASEASAALRFASRVLNKNGQTAFAHETLLSIGDLDGHLEMLTRAGRWDEALARAEQVTHHMRISRYINVYRASAHPLTKGLLGHIYRRVIVLGHPKGWLRPSWYRSECRICSSAPLDVGDISLFWACVEVAVDKRRIRSC